MSTAPPPSARAPLHVALAALAAAAATTACARSSMVPAPGAADPRALAEAWVSPIGRDHPLAGRILAIGELRWVDRASLESAVATADLVLLGEAHDNADHHLLQARLVRAVTAAGRAPALAFEMLDASQQQVVDAARATPGVTADGMGAAVGWPASGWPDFAIYRPIFEAALAAGLPLWAANLPRAVMRDVVHRGAAALPADVRAWLERAGVPTDRELRALRQEMQRAHCGELPGAMMASLVLAQRARDAQLGLRLVQAAAGRGAVLIAGAGHARNDRGVPAYLRREAAGSRVVAIGFIEVEPGQTRVEAYGKVFGTALPPFDFVVFTPAAEREDPCERLRRSMHHGRK